MGNSYFPDDTRINNMKNFFDFDNQSLVQFYHRNLAYIITLYIFVILFYILKKNKILYKPSLSF